MAKYDIMGLLKPIRFKEAEDENQNNDEQKDENSEQNKSQDNNDSQEGEKQDDNGQNNGDGQDNNEDNQDTNQGDDNQGDNNQEDSTEQKDNSANVDKTKNAINNVRTQITNCATEVDNLYKNNNFEGKYGAPMKKVHGDFTKFLWIGLGALVVGTVAFLVIKGIINSKKALANIPNATKALQGDKQAIQNLTGLTGEKIDNPTDTSNNTTVTSDANIGNSSTPASFTPGSNPAQLVDPNTPVTCKNTIEDQANATPGMVIQRNDGSKYVLTQGDIDWAKKQVNKTAPTDTVSGNNINSNNQSDTNQPEIDKAGIADIADNMDKAVNNSNNGKIKLDTSKRPTIQVNDEVLPPKEMKGVGMNYQPPKTTVDWDDGTSQELDPTGKPIQDNSSQPNSPQTTTNKNGNTTTTTTNGQYGTETTTTTNGTDGSFTQTKLATNNCGKYAGQQAPLTEEQAKQVAQNNGLPPKYSYLLTQNGCDQRQAVEAISAALMAVRDLKSGKSNFEYEKEWGQLRLAEYGNNCATAFSELLKHLYYHS